MATTITAGNATNGAAISSDNTGILELKSGTGSGTTAMTVGTGQNVTFAQAANLPNTFGFKNRIINGAMVIDQRNAGAPLTVNTGNPFFPVDRWVAYGQSADGVFTVQQSSVAPAGFNNSIVATVTTADSSIGATQYYLIGQRIEGYNFADFGFGAAGASSFTMSFWVRSSVTGSFGVAFENDAENRGYGALYTINAANTWEYKTITVPGDATGTWLKTNGKGLNLWFSLGIGSSYSVPNGGSWSNAVALGVTGQTNLISTNGATFYITGVQLEKGSTATSFDYRPYGTELQLCQRYFEKSYNDGTAIGAVTVVGVVGQSGLQGVTSTTEAGIYVTFKVTKRATPTIAVWDGNGNSNKVDRIQAGVTNNYNSTFSGTSNLGGNGFVGYSASGATCTSIQFHYTASSEL